MYTKAEKSTMTWWFCVIAKTHSFALWFRRPNKSINKISPGCICTYYAPWNLLAHYFECIFRDPCSFILLRTYSLLNLICKQGTIVSESIIPDEKAYISAIFVNRLLFLCTRNRGFAFVYMRTTSGFMKIGFVLKIFWCGSPSPLGSLIGGHLYWHAS